MNEEKGGFKMLHAFFSDAVFTSEAFLSAYRNTGGEMSLSNTIY